MERKLSAILAADVVGYSKLMAGDEAGTLAALQAHRDEIFNPQVAEYRGRIVKLIGDGTLAEFPSAVDAVDCALAIQTDISRAEAPVVTLRIGINIGDVIVDGDDIYGNGVNIAARLEAMADPGAICISATVFDQLDGEVAGAFNDLGSHSVKNIAKPVQVYGNFLRLSKASSPLKRMPFLQKADDGGVLVTGKCLCGAVRYQITKPAIDSGICHCRMCQRFTGAPISAGASYPIDALTITKGAPKYYRSSTIAERGFCGDCGSSLFYRPLARRWTDWIFVLSGNLDRPEDLGPEWHLGVESRMAWLHIKDDLPRVACKDSPGLIEAWENAEVEEG